MSNEGPIVRRCRCGTRLARDNAGPLCGACRTSTRMMKTGKPPVVPPSFWRDAPMREALKTWNMGRVLAAYRTHPHHGRPLPQDLVAGWAGLSQAQLSRIERGPAIKDLGKLIQWAQLLGIPEDSLWFRLAPPAATSSADSGRRPDRGHSMDGMPGPTKGPIAHAAAIEHFRTQDRLQGGAALYGSVNQYLADVVGPDLLGPPTATSDTVPVFHAAAGLTEMAGWMAHDAGDSPRAWQHFERARNLAELATGTDWQLRAHIEASMSHLSAYQGRPGDGLAHAVQGLNLLKRSQPHPPLEARLLAMQARARAALGQKSQVEALLDAARERLHETPQEATSTWISPFDQGSLAAEALRCYLIVEAVAQAHAEAQTVVHLRPGPGTRSRALGQAALTKTLVLRKELDHACAVGEHMLIEITHLDSAVVTAEIRALCALMRPYEQRSRSVGRVLPHLDRYVAGRARQAIQRRGEANHDGGRASVQD